MRTNGISYFGAIVPTMTILHQMCIYIYVPVCSVYLYVCYHATANTFATVLQADNSGMPRVL